MMQAHLGTTAGDELNRKARIRVNDVSKSFGDARVLSGLDWSIESGSVVGLLGLNGAGKSTLIRCMLGLLKPDSGSIRIDGEDVWDLSDQTKSRLSFVDQNAMFYPWMNGKQLLDHIGAMYPHWNEKLVADVAKEWNVPLDKRFGKLSPGQQQKVAILTAMGNEPDLLVLDEPVSSLDPVARRDFLRSLLEIAQDESRTVLLSTHITSDLERIASHVAILNEGKIQWFDELDDMKDRVKCVRIRSRSQSYALPSNLSVPHAIRVTVTGNAAVAIVGEWRPETESQLSQQHDVDIDVEDLNLEDIFVEVHGASDGSEAQR